MGRENPANPNAFGGVFSIAMAHGIHEGFVLTKLNSLGRQDTGDGLDQLIQ